MIWYRHWLELRPRLWVAGAIALLLGLLNPGFVSSAARYFAQYRKPTPELIWLRDFLPTLGGDTFVSWGVHTWTAAMVMTLIPLLVAGSGLRTQNGLGGVHPSTLYTLSLPVSRVQLVWTRFWAGVAATAALLLLLLLVDCLGLLVLGRAVPVGTMALSSLFAALAALPQLSLLGLITLALGEFWTASLWLALYIAATIWERAVITRLMVEFRIPWTAASVAVILTAAFLSLTMWLARGKEF